MNYKVINCNNIEELKKFPDNYFDSVVTDPPYGLGKEPDAVEVMTAWATTGFHEIQGSGFMGKEWDAFVPQPVFWKEVFRVLKHGGHIVAFFGTRTYDWGVMAMRFAGFEVRDCIQWIYGSGFPKSHNISKAIDKIEGNEREDLGEHPTIIGTGKKWRKNGTIVEYVKGWGSALKPANEPIVLARKPLEKGLSIAENVLKWGTGGINIDGCRIGFKDEADYKESTQKNQHQDFGTKPMVNNNTYGDWSMIQPKNYQPTGRFPANIILTHHPECECKGLKKVGSGKEDGYNYKGNSYEVKGFVPNNSPEANSNYGQETIEDWDCHPDCPIKILDEQSGIKQSTRNMSYKRSGGDFIDSIPNQQDKSWFQSEMGGASRFFYCAKASKSERNKGLIEFENKLSKKFDGGKFESQSTTATERLDKNFHPTVKPVKLMQYLVRLVTPLNGKVLDPFCGSGTTGIACKLEGFDFVGLEQDPEYCKIAEARITNFTEDPEEVYKFYNEESQITQLKFF